MTEGQAIEQPIRVWLSKKGSRNSSRKFPSYLEGRVTMIGPYNEYVRVQFDFDGKTEFGTYHWKDGYLCRNKPKVK